MRKTLYISGIIILIGVLAGLFIFIKQYNKPHIDVLSSGPDHVMTAENMIKEYVEDEKKANSKYLDRIVQVEGVVKEISTANGNSVITLQPENLTESIICNMRPTENKKVFGLQNGQKISIRGVCTGFLLDVILVRAVIVH